MRKDDNFVSSQHQQQVCFVCAVADAYPVCGGIKPSAATAVFLFAAAAARQDNSLADKLSNLAMDTDGVVEQIAAASVRCGGGGGGNGGNQSVHRKQVAQQLAEAAQVDQDQR
jgi:hypothetical protein